MSAPTHRSTPEASMDPFAGQPYPSRDSALQSADNAGSTKARLQIIHDLVRAGDYHVPATAIADRMIERLMIERRGHGS
jgi:hypothetical protein